MGRLVGNNIPSLRPKQFNNSAWTLARPNILNMNFREKLANLNKPMDVKFNFNIIAKLQDWLFWRKAKRRHKRHALNWAIYKEGKFFYPAKSHVFFGSIVWEYIGKPGAPNDLYLWSGEYRKHAACKTRYSALRRIALARRKYCFTEVTRT